MRKRFLACLLSLSIAFSQMPAIAFAEGGTEISNLDTACILTEGCTLLSGHEGECVVKTDTELVCAGLDGCVEGQHDEACPMYVVSSKPEQVEETETNKEEKAEDLDDTTDEEREIRDSSSTIGEGEIDTNEVVEEYTSNLQPSEATPVLSGSLDGFGGDEVYDDRSLEEVEKLLSGAGTEEDPYRIYTAEEFYLINYIEYWYEYLDLGTAYYRQMDDIDLSQCPSESNEPAYITADFGGVFDGNGYVFHNAEKTLFFWVIGEFLGDDLEVFSQYQSGDCTQLFSTQLKNIVIEEPEIDKSANSNLAALALNTRSAAVYGCEVNGGSITSHSGAAGLVNSAYSTVFDTCNVRGIRLEAVTNVGGIVYYADSEWDSTAGHMTGALVLYQCTTSGDYITGSSYSGGIVASLDDQPDTSKVPARVIECASTANITSTNERGETHIGGIVGMSWAWTALQGNRFDGSITVNSDGSAANYIGGLVGYLNTDTSDGTREFIISDCSAEDASLPEADPESDIYVGRIAGRLTSSEYQPSGNPDDYGYISALHLSGYTGELNLPGTLTLYADETCNITSIVADGNILIKLNKGTIGSVTSTNGNITVESNQGVIGDLTAKGSVSIGVYNKNADDTDVYGNDLSYGNGSESAQIGNINAGSTVAVYRNLGTIGSITSTDAGVAIGYNNQSYDEYQVNSGIIGAVRADTSVGIYNNATSGKIAVSDGENVTAGTSIAVGALSGTTILYENKGTIGNLISLDTTTSGINVYSSGTIGDITKEKGTGAISVYATDGAVGNIINSDTINIGTEKILNNADIGTITITGGGLLRVYNREATIGNIKTEGAGNITIGTNNGTLGDIQCNAGVTIGAGNKSSDDTTLDYSYGNGVQGEIGNITAASSITLYRNLGVIGDITSQAGGITIGQNNEQYDDYQINAGTIGSINVKTSVAIYNNTAEGKIAAGSEQAITAYTSISIGYADKCQNKGTIGNIKLVGGGSAALSVYSLEETGTIGNIYSDCTGNVTIGAKDNPQQGTVGTVTAPKAIVLGYSNVPFTVNALANRVAFSTTDTYTTDEKNVTVKVENDATVVKSGDTILHTYTGDVKDLRLNSASTVTIESGVSLREVIDANGSLTVYNQGNIEKITNATGTLTIGSSANPNQGTIGCVSVSGTGNLNVYNAGTITQVINTGTKPTTIVTSTKIADVQNGTGLLMLMQQGTETLTEALFGDITLSGSLSITSNIGVNEGSQMIRVHFKNADSPNINGGGNNAFYLSCDGTVTGTLTLNSTTSKVNEKLVNLIDVSAVTGSTSFVSNVGTGTQVVSPADSTPVTGDSITTNNTVISGEKTGNVTAASSVTAVEITDLGDISGILYMSGSTATIYNYGNITAVDYAGTGAMTIYNMTKSARIGTINAPNASGITIVHNAGHIGDIQCAKGTVSIGFANKKVDGAEKVHVTGGTETIAYGNIGTLGNITSGFDIAIYRNVETIGNVESSSGQVTIGQYNATYSAYQINDGTIGSIAAGTAVKIYNNSANGKIATGEEEKVTGTSIAIGNALDDTKNQGEIGHLVCGDGTGSVTVYSIGKVGNITKETGTGSVLVYAADGLVGNITNAGAINIGSTSIVNGAQIGSVTGTGSGAISVYNGKIGHISGKIGHISAIVMNGTGAVTVTANDGTIDEINAAGGVTVGAVSKAADETGYAYGNGTSNSQIGSIKADGSITVYRNCGTIGSIESTAGSVTIGQNLANYAKYQVNSGTIGNIKADVSVGIYNNTTTGKIAAEGNEAVTAGGSINIGAVVNNAMAYENQGVIGNVVSNNETINGIAVYSSAGQIGNITKENGTGTVSVYVTDSEVGDITNSNSINIGSAAILNQGKVGNLTITKLGNVTINNAAGKIGNVKAAGTGSIVVNTNNGTIGTLESEGTVTIGASNKSADNTNPQYSFGNATDGQIGDITAQKNVTVYRNAGIMGDISSDQGNIIIGQNGEAYSAYQGNSGKIGSVEAIAGTVSIYNHAQTGKIATENGEYVRANTGITIGTSSYDASANRGVIGPIEGGDTGSITLYNAGTLGKITAPGKCAINATLFEGCEHIMASVATGKTTILNRSVNSRPVIDLSSSGSVSNQKDEGCDYAILNMVSYVTGRKSVEVSGDLGSLIVAGDGTVYSTSANYQIGSVIVTGNGSFFVRGGTGDIVADNERDFILTMEQHSGNIVDIYLNYIHLLPEGTVKVKISADHSFDVQNAQSSNGDEYEFTVKGNTLREKIATLILKETGTTHVEVSGQFDAQLTQEGINYTLGANKEFVVPALVEHVYTAFLADETAFEQAQTRYGWDETIAKPEQYPVIAVIPTFFKGATAATTKLAGTEFEDVIFCAVPKDAVQLDHQISLGLLAAEQENYPSYQEDIFYTITMADVAACDTEHVYHTVQFQYNMLGMSMEEKFVLDGTSIQIPEAPERPGYSFLYWKLGDIIYHPGDTYKPDGNAVFQAVWGASAQLRTLTIDSGDGQVKYVQADGTLIEISNSMQFIEGTQITLQAINVGRYYFDAWQIAGADAVVDGDQITFTMNQDVTVTALFYRSSGGGASHPEAGSSSGADRDDETHEEIIDEETPLSEGIVDPFVDVSIDSWYADAVQYVYENGMMSGTSETTFSPDLTTTRGMIVTILYRMENEPAVTGTTAFTDVAADQYYANAVAWAAQNGIVSGTTATTFAPNSAITREQMAAILYRYAQFKGYDVSAKADLSVYTDAASVGAYAVDAMAWANGAGLITGTSATTLTPAGNATRAQVAAILMRFGENIAK